MAVSLEVPLITDHRMIHNHSVVNETPKPPQAEQQKPSPVGCIANCVLVRPAQQTPHLAADLLVNWPGFLLMCLTAIVHDLTSVASLQRHTTNLAALANPTHERKVPAITVGVGLPVKRSIRPVDCAVTPVDQPVMIPLRWICAVLKVRHHSMQTDLSLVECFTRIKPHLLSFYGSSTESAERCTCLTQNE
jgi:hypothetical protein